MPATKIATLLIFLTLLTVSCRELDKLSIKEEPIINKLCYVEYAGHGHNIAYSFIYDNANVVTGMEGFHDFNKIIYEKGLPVRAENSRDKSYYITFEYDTKGGLSGITFTGRDSAGKLFTFHSTVFTNANKQAEKINLTLPIYSSTLETTIDYDKNGNVAKISIMKDGKLRPILENLSFDSRQSPYAGVHLSNAMLHFVIFSACVGYENTTYFINKNNATATRIYAANGDIDLSYQYDYNKEGFPTKTRISRKFNGKEENYTETFSYNCPN